MNKILFDMKISSCFTGTLIYERTETLTGNKLNYQLNFLNGELTDVLIVNLDDPWDFKALNHKRWNGDFWKKAPKYANYDNCSWKRIHVHVNLDLINLVPHHGTILS